MSNPNEAPLSTTSAAPPDTPAPRLKVAQVTTVAVSVVALMKGWPAFLTRRGVEVHTISSPGVALAEFARREGVARVHEIPIARPIAPLADLVSLWRLWRLMRREGYTLVHASTPKGGLLGTLAAWLTRVPVRVYTLRGLPLAVATGFKRRVLWLTDWLAMRLATHVTAISPSLRQEAIDLGLVSARKCVVIGSGSSNGIDAERFTRRRPAADAPLRAAWNVPHEALLIGFVGRIVRDKGVIELEAAWRTLRERFPAAFLVLVGTPESQDPVNDDVMRRLRDDERVRLPGWYDDTVACFEAMDLLVLPTHREGFGNVYLEANAMELAVVGTTITGVRDAVLDGETGLLVPPRDAAALADAVARLLSDAALREQMGRAGRARVVRDFRPEAIWKGMFALYRAALAERGVRMADS